MPSPLISPEIRERVRALIPQLTLDEKASLLVGRDFWSTQPIERLGIPSIWMTDGPTGVRKAPESGGIGIGDAEPATCFPTASLQAATWNRNLIEEVGRAIGQEARQLGVQIVLGPGVNMKRSPLGGRNFEYMSEDPVLAGELAGSFISGVQSEGVGTSIKHFVANENETLRMIVDAIVDERTLREIYLRSFEIAIERAQPWTVMCAYNRLNGAYCAEDYDLLTEILKNDWGYDGIVVSDWGAVNDRPAGVEAGLHLQMPHAPTAGDVVAAVERGDLARERLDTIVGEMLAITFLAAEATGSGKAPDMREHRELARRVAREGIVLLKNESDALPIPPDTSGTVAVIGAFAETPRFQGSGSSQVTPTHTTSLMQALPEMLPDATLAYAPGYSLETDAGRTAIDEAVALARNAAAAIVVVGLPEEMDAEGSDRADISLPPRHDELVKAVAAVQPRTVVVLINGSAVAMPWVSDVPAIIESWLAGQESGAALAEVLTGVASPSGKLSETFPVRIEDTPAFGHFPTEGDGTARFTEGVFMGYRWYDARKIEPLFPFGHGLSYTTFAFEGLAVNSAGFEEDDTIEVSVTVENTGTRAGAEVVQLYVGECSPLAPRPVRELKAFAKIYLEPGEEQAVQFTLGWQDLAYWDTTGGGWVMRSGEYDFAVGSSSRDLRLSARAHLDSGHEPVVVIDRMTPFSVALSHPVTGPILKPQADQIPPQLMQFIRDIPLWKVFGMSGQPPEQLEALIAAANAME